MPWDWWGRKRKVAASVLRRMTGFSTPLGGISWKNPTPEQELVRKFLIFLEDRRALYNPTWTELAHEVVQSIIEIRRVATEHLQSLDDGSFADHRIRNVRSACRRFLDGVDRDHPIFPGTMMHRDAEASFFVALGELRASVGHEVAALCAHYDLSIEGDLSMILPPSEHNSIKDQS